RAAAQVPARRRRLRRAPAARSPARAGEGGLRSVALLVSAAWRRRRPGSAAGGTRFRLARADPAPDAHVPFLGLAECLAAANSGAQPALRRAGDGGEART